METFGQALVKARSEAGLSQSEVGELVGVDHSAVSHWELGVSVPISAHYTQLLDLFPELRAAPCPDVRDMEKPGREPLPKSSRRPKGRTRARTAAFDDAPCDCAELGLSCGLCRRALARAV